MSPRTNLRHEVARLRRMSRPLDGTGALAPLPPALPPGRIVDVPGRGEMFVREAPGPAGGPTIVLLHGWTVSADLNWFGVYARAAELGPVIAVDHRGHGRGIRTAERFTLEDCADDVAVLLGVLGTGPVIVVGYSMGGPIAMLFWQRHPELVAGLVLEATALEWRASWRERFVWKLMALAEVMFRFGPSDGFLDRYLRESADQAPEVAELRGWFKGELRRGDAAAQADAGRALGMYDARPFAGRVDVPAAVVVTTEDRLVRPRKQRALAKAIPGARTFELAADHDAALVQHRQMAAVTVEALRSVLDRRAVDAAQPTAGASASPATTP